MRDTKTNLFSAVLAQVRTLPPLPAGTSFAGQTVVVTGATGSILGGVARLLAERGASRLVLGVRSQERGRKAAAEITAGLADPPAVLLWDLDLTSFASVVRFTERAERELERVDLVLCGAAVLTTTVVGTVDGWEQTLQVVHLSHSLLSVLLLPLLVRTAHRHSTTTTLVDVSSVAALFSPAIPTLPAPSPSPLASASPPPSAVPALLTSLNTISGPWEKIMQYPKAKLMHLHFLRTLARRLPEARGHVQVHQVDPGMTVSELANAHMFSRLVGSMGLLRPLESCTKTVANACVPREGTHGALFRDYHVLAYPKSMDSQIGKQLEKMAWDETCQVLSGVSSVAKSILDNLEAGTLGSEDTAAQVGVVGREERKGEDKTEHSAREGNNMERKESRVRVEVARHEIDQSA